jgi:hypothetical protein
MSSLAVQGGATGTGTVSLLAPVTNTNRTLTLPDVTDTVAGIAATQTLTNKTLSTGLVMGASTITSGTSVASTSGTSIDFTGIPSWVKRITVMLQGVSTTGTDNLLIQLGTSGGIVSTGYVAGGQSITSGTATTSSTAGFTSRTTVGGAAGLTSGILTIANLTSGTWVASGVMNQSANGLTWAGAVTSVGTVDRVRITTVAGTDTFDAGSINILFE